MSVKDSAFSGIKWTSLSQAARALIQFGATVALARLLAPSDFGLLGMAVVAIGFVNIFADLGTSAAVIQKKDPGPCLLPSVFWVNVGFSAAAALVLFASASLIANFYDEPRLVPVIRALSSTFLFTGMSMLQRALLQRDLAFDKLAGVEIASIAVGAAVGIGHALTRASVWSLVWQTIATSLISMTLLWIVSPWRPEPRFSMEEIKSIYGFSANLTAFNIFNYFSRNADYLLIGKYLGSAPFGYYNLAYRLLLFPLRNISDVVGRVMFPVFSIIQDDNARFRQAYLKVVGAIAAITFPMMLGLLALREPLTLAALGLKWRPIIPLVAIFAPVGMIQSILTTVGSIYQAKGRTDWQLKWGIVSGTVVIVAFAIGLRWGVVGVAVAYAIVSGLLVVPGFMIPFRLIELKMADLAKTLAAPFGSGAVMFLAVEGFRAIATPHASQLVVLLAGTAFGAAVYGALNWAFNRKQIYELLEIVKKRNISAA